MPGVTPVARRPRPAPAYVTPAGYRLRSRRSKLLERLSELASSIWESSWLTRQALVAVLLFALAFGLMRAPWPFLASARNQVAYYLSTDFDLRGATEYVMSTNLTEKVSEGWKVLPELWNRLTGRSDAPSQDSSFILPVVGTVTSNYGYRPDPVTGEVAFHAGIDIGAAEGTPIVAALGGTVLTVENNETYGNVVEIDHGQGVMTLYAHAKTITVKTGDMVKQGDTIGTVGMTGNATDPNCHFEVIISGQPVDPLQMRGLAGTP